VTSTAGWSRELGAENRYDSLQFLPIVMAVMQTIVFGAEQNIENSSTGIRKIGIRNRCRFSLPIFDL